MQTNLEKTTNEKFLLASLIIVAATILIANFISEDAALYAGTLSYIPTAGAMVVLSIIIASKFRFSGNHGKAWFVFALCATSWFIAEMCWSYLEFEGLDPYPSIADVFWIIGFGLFFVFSILYLQPVKQATTKPMIFGAVGIGLMMFIPSLYVVLTTSNIETMEVSEWLVGLAYPLFDSLILIPAAIGVTLFFKGQVNFMWTLILIGFVIFSVADTLFLMGQMEDTYYTGHPMEMLWLWAYVLFSFGIYNHYKIFGKNQIKSKNQ